MQLEFLFLLCNFVDSDGGVAFGTIFFNVRLNKPSRKRSVIQLISCKCMLNIYVGRLSSPYLMITRLILTGADAPRH